MFEYLRRIRAVARRAPFDTSTPEGRSNERYRLIVFATASGMVVRAFGVVAGLVTVPLLLGYLGKERYGLWTAITTIVTWATLFDLGLSNGLVNLISRAHGRDDRAAARGAFVTAFLALVCVALALGTTAAIALPRISWSSLLGAQGIADESLVRWSVGVALGAFLLGLPLATVPQLYSGYQKAYVANLFALVGTAVALGALVASVRLGAAMPVLVLCLSSAGVVSAASALAFVRRTLPWIEIKLSHVSRLSLRALSERSVPIFLFQLGALAVNETQVLILARRSGLAIVADYAVAFRLYAVVVSLIQLGTASMVPSLREAHERGDHDWMKRAFRNLRALRMTLAAVGAVALSVFGDVLLRFWLGRSDMVFGWRIWAPLAVLMLAAVWSTAHVEFLWIMDRLWPLVGIVLPNGALTVGLTWWLAPSQGVAGAVMASAAFTVFVSSWLLPLLARSLLHTRSRSG